VFRSMKRLRRDLSEAVVASGRMCWMSRMMMKTRWAASSLVSLKTPSLISDSVTVELERGF